MTADLLNMLSLTPSFTRRYLLLMGISDEMIAEAVEMGRAVVDRTGDEPVIKRASQETTASAPKEPLDTYLLLRTLFESSSNMFSRRHLRLVGISNEMIAAAAEREEVVVSGSTSFASVILTGDGIAALAVKNREHKAKLPNERERLVEAARKPMPEADLIRNWLAWVTVDGYRTDGERVDAGTLLDMIDASPGTAVPNQAAKPPVAPGPDVEIRAMTVAQLRAALNDLPDEAPVCVECYVPGGGEDGKHGGLLVHVEGWMNEITGVSAVLWSAEAE